MLRLVAMVPLLIFPLEDNAVNGTTLREVALGLAIAFFHSLGYYAPYRPQDEDGVRRGSRAAYLPRRRSCREHGRGTRTTSDFAGNTVFRDLPAYLNVTSRLHPPGGMAWQGRCLRRSLSAYAPSITQDLLRRPKAGRLSSIPCGTLYRGRIPTDVWGLGSGAWCAALALQRIIEPPLLLPEQLMERGYAVRARSRMPWHRARWG